MADQTIRDLRHAVRSLLRDRGFTVTTLATLALCLAANAAIFAVVQAVILRPLPFPEPERLVTIQNSYPGAGAPRADNGVPDYDDRRRETTAFEEIAVYRTSGSTVGGDGGEPERLTSMQATPSFFRILRASPHRGRLFTDEDGEVGQHEKVLLSYGLWQRMFAGRDAAVGQTLRVNGVVFTVIGVMPADFRFVSNEVQLWTPAAFTPADRADDRRHSNSWQMLARLKRGASIAGGQQQIDALNTRNLDRFPHFKELLVNAGFHTRVVGFHDDLVSESRGTLWLLWAFAAFVLLIGALNVANLVSVRATAQVRELVTRLALGASLGSLTRQILTEALVLTSMGGALGLLLGWWALRAAPVLGLDALPRGAEISLDGWVAIYTLGLVALVGMLVAIVPVLRLRHVDVAAAIREEGRSGTATRRTLVVRRVLVAGQVAFALVLLVGAGLLLASFDRILAINPGFKAEGVFTGRISLPLARYADDQTVRAAYDRLLPALRGIPGVTAAGLTGSLPFGGDYSDSVILAEGYQMAAGESVISPSQVNITEGLIDALGMSVVRGRAFTTADGQGAPRAVLVDERLAQRFWPGQDPIGRRMFLPSDPNDLLKPPPDDGWLNVVGVVGGVRLRALAEGGGNSGLFGAYYFPIAQVADRGVAIVLRTSQSPESLTSAVRAAVREMDPSVPLFDVRAMASRLDGALTDRRTPMILAVSFAAVALLLAAIGLYGVLAYQVAQRSREIGIRIALGASAPGIFQMVLREGALVVGAGAVVGLAGAWLLRRTVQGQLYEVDAMDPRVIGAVAVVLGAVALVACVLPARRAASTDPAIALADR
jgi:predicted permease